MSIRVNVHPGMLPLTGNRSVIEVDGSTVGECLERLIGMFPGVKSGLLDEGGRVLDHVDIFVNGRSSYPEELAKPVRDGDELWILQVFGGG